MGRHRIFLSLLLLALAISTQAQMFYKDTDRLGVPFAKDPVVVSLNGRYLMYYSVPPYSDKRKGTGWNIGIAESRDLENWKKIGEMTPQTAYEENGLCAPGALVRNDTVHLFYQTYGNGRLDAICHAYSTDGLHFERDATNPIFHPEPADWTCGRAIDAEVTEFKGQYFLFFATRDPAFENQMLGVATAPKGTDFRREDWTLRADSSILRPTLPWEGKCIEGASVIKHKGKLYMVYAGSYNNDPQQIGSAVSKDGIRWKRLSDEPLLRNGAPGTWNESESGHPCIFRDKKGKIHLFYQGNNTHGKNWILSSVALKWNKKGLEVASK